MLYAPTSNTGEAEVEQFCEDLQDLLELTPKKSDSVRPHGLQPTRLLRPWDFPGKSTGVGCHCLLRVLVGLLQYAELCDTAQAG